MNAPTRHHEASLHPAPAWPVVPHCEYDPDEFQAIVIETVDARLLRVTGRAVSPTSGWTVGFAAANPGIVPHPDSLWLEIREQTPRDARDGAPAEVDFEAIIEDSRAQEVVIRFRWREGFILPVRERERVLAGR